jgi:hypothetical protein
MSLWKIYFFIKHINSKITVHLQNNMFIDLKKMHS